MYPDDHECDEHEAADEPDEPEADPGPSEPECRHAERRQMGIC
jgi:hypothetical protein